MGALRALILAGLIREKCPRSVWLLRHGQTDWNLARRYMSASDRPLTPYGERQARALGAMLATRKIDVIIHSGLARTRDTALAVRGERKITLVEDARWREASHGCWEGLTYRDVMRQFPEGARARFADPVNTPPLDGESLAQLQARVASAYEDLAARHPGKRVLVVTHGGAIQALLCTLLAVPLDQHWRWRIDLGSATGVDVYPGTTILRAVNHVPRLKTHG
jgi:alpha-ribazole phosphatase